MKKMISLTLALLLGMTGLTAFAAEPGLRDYQPLKELSAQHGFLMGAPLSYNQLADAVYLMTIRHHFDTITCTNEMKAYSLLDLQATQAAGDGMPRMNFTQADKMVEFAMKNGMRVRGHVLVWDAYMTQWFFHEDFDVSKPIADRETLLARMQYYIETVVTHFEEKYPGVVYCWDVVNEAVGDNASEWAVGDARHVRTMRSGSINPFYEYVGPDYVEYAFLFAADTVEKLGADIGLFYNDYNMFFSGKREAAIELVKSINSFATDAEGNPRQLCTGIGMQGYIGGYGTQSGCMQENHLTDIKKSIQMFHDELGIQVQLTEMAVRNYDEALVEEHAAFYQRLFKVFKSINRGQEEPILTSVAIWGLVDIPYEPKSSYNYKMNGTHGGLFGYRCTVKPAFLLVHEELGLE
ncbi:MAG: endo-1,4-beta-xylanase [Clostridia bacterium]|nr:endo-1,4-beta-xylanase [Clostridia bacterium]